MDRLAWHYTTGAKFELIVASGWLKTSQCNMGGRQTERPVVWFSINQKWELSASYTGVRNGKLYVYSMQETKDAGGGLVRLGYSQQALTPWKDILKQARIEKSTQRYIEKSGMIPFQWMGYFFNIPVQDLVIEVLNDLNQWEGVGLSMFPVLSKEAYADKFIELGYGAATAPTLGLEEKVF